MAENYDEYQNDDFNFEDIDDDKPLEADNTDVNEDGETGEYSLLAGYQDKDGVLYDRFTLREMTGRDEEVLTKASRKKNPTKAMTTLISRCVTTLNGKTRKEIGSTKWDEIFGNMYIGDQDYIFMKLREISVGEEIESVHRCPSCNAQARVFSMPDEYEVLPFKGKHEIPFELPRGFTDRKGVLHKKGVMRLPTAVDRDIVVPISDKNPTEANTKLLERICKFDDEYPITSDTMADLVVRDRKYLTGLLDENSFGVDTTIEVDCPECGHIFEGKTGNANFM